MRFGFEFGCIYVYLAVVWENLNFFDCDRTLFRDILAFFNGGIRSGSGYWFISEHGLLHFAFLINELDAYHARWRLEWFDYRKCQGDDSWF